MEYIHVKNLERFHPGYKDRKLSWAKIHFKIVTSPKYTRIPEVDKYRFISLVCLELLFQEPTPVDNQYFKGLGWDLKKRPISLTLKMLHTLVDVSTEECVIEKSRVEESRVEEIREDFQSFVTEITSLWNSFCNKYPTLPKIQSISDTRRNHLKKRYEQTTFKNFEEILSAIDEQPFLRGENGRGWKASLDWLIANDTNHIKVLERKYKDGTKSKDPAIFRNQ